MVYLTFPFTFSFSLALPSSMLNARIVWMIYWWSMEITTRPSMVMVGRSSMKFVSTAQRASNHSFVIKSSSHCAALFFLLRNRRFHRCETINESVSWVWNWNFSDDDGNGDKEEKKSHQKVKGSLPRRHFLAISHKGAIQRRGDNEQQHSAFDDIIYPPVVSSRAVVKTTTMKMLKWLFDERFSEREKSSYHLHNYIVFG